MTATTTQKNMTFNDLQVGDLIIFHEGSIMEGPWLFLGEHHSADVDELHSLYVYWSFYDVALQEVQTFLKMAALPFITSAQRILRDGQNILGSSFLVA